jgi:hypothetical protein
MAAGSVCPAALLVTRLRLAQVALTAGRMHCVSSVLAVGTRSAFQSDYRNNALQMPRQRRQALSDKPQRLTDQPLGIDEIGALR